MAAKLVWPLMLILKIQFDTAHAQCVNRLTLTAHLGYSGQITSPNYPNNYDNQASCEWLLTASTGVVVVSIQDMLLENRYDYLYFYDGSSTSSSLLGRYTSSATAVITSTSSTLLVRFYTDSSVTRPGFKLTYFALYSSSSANLHDWPDSTCGSSISITTNDIQQLKLPSAPASTYSPLTNCEVTFSVSASNLNVTILWSDLAFVSNDLNATSTAHCNQQRGLSVWEGTGSTLLYWLCTAEQSPDDTIVLYPTQTSVLFRYNSPYNLRGPVISIQKYAGTAATATVPVLTTQSVISSCGSTSLISETYHKYLTSPYYPAYYSNNLACTWVITSNDLNGAITLTIISLYTEPSHDYLYVYDGPSSSYPVLGGMYSGTSLNVGLTSSSAYVTLYFYTDHSVRNSGFYISYINTAAATPTCVAGYSPIDELDASTTESYVYSHTGYPSINYNNGYVKYWLIKKPDVTDTLYFYFSAFRLEACSYDTLKVYDGSCVSDTLVYTFCGDMDISTKYTVSLGRYVLFYMSTDGSVRHSGFDMRYQIGDDTADDETDDDGVPVAAIVAPVVIVSIIIIAVLVVCKGKVLRTTKPTTKVSPPNINKLDFKLTTTTKVKVPKQKPIRKKVVVPPPPNPQLPPAPPIPTTLQHPVHPPPPYGLHDPAYPPQYPGGSAAPTYQTYSNPQHTPMATDVPNPFVYTPPS